MTEPTRPPLHVLLYSDSGGGKSTVAATFPKPMLVFAFDPRGKEMPYYRRPDGTTYGRLVNVGADEAGTPALEVLGQDADGEFLQTRIEMYHDVLHYGPSSNKPTATNAYPRFLSRMHRLDAELAAGEWATIVIDSVTFMELCARKYAQYVVNRASKEPRQWFAYSTDAIEEMLMMRFGALPVNVVVCAHVDEDKDEVHGFFVRNPKAPGRTRKSLPSAYPEFYRACVVRDEKGDVRYQLQTAPDAVWNASSQIGAPNPCAPDYEALWRHWS